MSCKIYLLYNPNGPETQLTTPKYESAALSTLKANQYLRADKNDK